MNELLQVQLLHHLTMRLYNLFLVIPFAQEVHREKAQPLDSLANFELSHYCFENGQSVLLSVRFLGQKIRKAFGWLFYALIEII